METIQEVFDNNRIPICFAANNNFLPYTAVMIKSIIINSNIQYNYDIIVLYTDISTDYINKVESMCLEHSNISIRFVNIEKYIDKTEFFTQSVYTGTVYTNEAYYRLLIPELMSTYDKVLYFDGDMIAVSDVAELYLETDMTGYMLASSRDYAGISNCYMPGDPRREYRSNILGLKNIDNYILSGMLVFNPAEFNKRYTGKQLMQICSSKKWRQHDQDVLNVVCENSLKIISGAWDYMEDYGNIKFLPKWLQDEYKATSENIKIVHYAGPRKPWKFNNSFKSDEFWDICYQTPFFKIIFENMSKNYGYKNSILSHIYNNEPNISYTVNDAYLSNGDFFIGKMSDIYTQIDSLQYRGGYLELDGFANTMGIKEDEPIDIYLSVNGKLNKCNKTNRNCSEYKFNRLLYRGISFNIKLRLDSTKNNTLKLVIKIRGDHFVVNKNLRFGRFCALNETKNKYYFSERCIFTTNCQTITMTPSGLSPRIKHEINYQKTLPYKYKLLRTALFVHKKLSRKQIWLLADRTDKAGDNAEAYFSYLQKHRIKGIKPIFVIDKQSEDYKRIRKIGKVIDINSKLYRFYLVRANKIISSHFDSKLINYNKKVFSDVSANQSHVFLQHGITKDDVSSIYSKYNQNINLFITAGKEEYQSIISNPNYGLSESEVGLTGFARFDILDNNPKKIISILPTWRQDLCALKEGKWKLKEDFEQSSYYKYYYSLLTDKSLQNELKKSGYSLEFIQHPIMSESNKAFEKIPNINVKSNSQYNKIFENTSLLITDYSSVAFDVAYLKKPIIYFQFDKDEFFALHTYKQGYFDYESHGFGEVCYDVDSVVSTIIKYIKTNCTIKDEYNTRIEKFFAYIDRSNCERITSEIMKMR